MAAPSDHNHLLDQLQKEVNRVLEQTGKIFSASNKDIKSAPAAAHATRLRQILPDSLNRFHDALDQLEDDLYMAKMVMRRDLALCRERSKVENRDEMSSTTALERNGDLKKLDDLAKIDSKEPQKIEPDEDVMMLDSPPANLKPEPRSVDQSGLNSPAKLKQEDTVSTEEVRQQLITKAVSNAASRETGAGLQIDTKAATSKDEKAVANPDPAKNSGVKDEGDDDDDDKPPDTATVSNAADLESLFGGSASAGDTGADFTLDETFDFDFNATAMDQPSNPGTETGTANTNTQNDPATTTAAAAAEVIDLDALLGPIPDTETRTDAPSPHPPVAAAVAAAAPPSKPQGDVEPPFGEGEGEDEMHQDSFADLMDFADFGNFAAEGDGGEFDFNFR